MKNQISVNDIISFLKLDVLSVLGDIEDVYINNLKPSEFVNQYTLDWIDHLKSNKQKIAENSKAIVVIADKEVNYSDTIKQQGKVLIYVNNPRLIIAKVANEFFVDKLKPAIHPSATIHPDAILGKDVFIGPNVVIGKCEIGDNVVIHGNAYFYDNVSIGDNVIIHAGCIIGVNGLGCTRSDEGILSVFPHIGGVTIKNNVEIGANSQIARGALSNTIIGEGSKLNGLCFIAHNCILGENVLITGNTMLAGSVKVGNNTTLFSQVVIREQRTIGQNVIIGMGAVVTKDVPDGETWIGNPAKKMINK